MPIDGAAAQHASGAGALRSQAQHSAKPRHAAKPVAHHRAATASPAPNDTVSVMAGSVGLLFLVLVAAGFAALVAFVLRLHSCAGYFYKLTDWELSVKAVALAPRFARVQTLMRGNTKALLAPVLQLPERLRATIERHAAGAPGLAVSASVEDTLLQPLIAEVARVRALAR
jgi:hypothetical protein